MVKRLFTSLEIQEIRSSTYSLTVLSKEYAASRAMLSLIRNFKAYFEELPPDYIKHKKFYRCLKDKRGFEFYVRSDGKVWSVRKGLFLSQHINADGYAIVSIDGKPYRLNRLLLILFKRKPLQNEQARHLDGVKLNNRLSNLAWGSPIINAADKVRHGTDSKGERNAAAKLTLTDVERIRKLYSLHKGSNASFVREMKISYPVVSSWTLRNIINGVSWQ